MSVGQEPVGHRLGFGFAQGISLGLAPALRHGLGKVGKQDGEPQPQGDLKIEAEAGIVVLADVFDQQH